MYWSMPTPTVIRPSGPSPALGERGRHGLRPLDSAGRDQAFEGGGEGGLRLISVNSELTL